MRFIFKLKKKPGTSRGTAPPPQPAIPFIDLIYCPKKDLNHLHAISASKKTAICSGCGEVIRRKKEINFRRRIAKKNGINKYKAFIERKV